jgi:preprotein translocase subunit SecB
MSNGSDEIPPSADGADGEQAKSTPIEPTTESRPPLTINAQYVKDLSFEAPATPHVFSHMRSHQPDISINVEVESRRLDAVVHEVVLHLRSECKIANTPAFLMELAYAGVFTVNVAPSDLDPLLMIECPRFLFPFARQIISSTTMNAGFMPLMLGPVDFVSLYQKHLLDREAQAVQGSTQLA